MRQRIAADVARDLHGAWRQARHAPWLTALVVAMLAIGTGSSTAIFSVINNTLLRPMMLQRVDQLVRIDEVSVGPGGRGDETNVAPLTAEALLAGGQSYSAATVQDARVFVLTGEGAPERLRGAGIARNWHATLGVLPIVGRQFSAEELSAGANAGAVLIGEGLWTRRFGRQRDVVGRVVTLNGAPHTIVGVMPRGFRFPYEAEVWTPITYDAEDGASRYLLLFARVRPESSVDALGAELNSITARLAEAHPATHQNRELRAQSLRENLVRGADRTAFMLLATVGFLLIITCVNVGAVVLARGQGRRRELLVRAALGASRERQIRQLVVETLILTFAGVLLGLLLALVLRPHLGLLVPPVMSVELAQNQIALDWRVLSFTAGLTMLSAVVSGLLPAWRSLPTDLQGALREEGRSGLGRRGRRAVRAIVIGEVALAMVLLTGAISVVLGFAANFEGAPGYSTERILNMRASLAEATYPSHDARVRTTAALLEAVEAVPGIEAVALSTSNPRRGGWTATVTRPELATDITPVATQYVAISDQYFETLSTPFIEGRGFNASDRMDSPPVAIVSRSLASALWGQESPVGRHVALGPDSPPATVVGVVADTRWLQPPNGAVFVPYAQVRSTFVAREFDLMIRTSAEPMAQLIAIQRAIWSVDATLPLFAATLLRDVESAEYALERTGAGISVGFGIFGTLLAALGIFGAFLQAAIQSRRESAVRKALGATQLRLLTSQLGAAALNVAIGCALGILGGQALNALLRGLLSGVATIDLPTYLGAAALMLAVGLAASVSPAIRVARTNAMQVLREG